MILVKVTNDSSTLYRRLQTSATCDQAQLSTSARSHVLVSQSDHLSRLEGGRNATVIRVKLALRMFDSTIVLFYKRHRSQKDNSLEVRQQEVLLN